MCVGGGSYVWVGMCVCVSVKVSVIGGEFVCVYVWVCAKEVDRLK